MLSRIARDHGRLDILVDNAGVAILLPIQEMTLAHYERQMSINLTSAFLGMRLGGVLMRRTGHGRSIINISSVGGIVGLPRTHAYGARKAAMRVFGKGLAIETAKDNIRVHPGSIRTA